MTSSWAHCLITQWPQIQIGEIEFNKQNCSQMVRPNQRPQGAIRQLRKVREGGCWYGGKHSSVQAFMLLE